MRIKLMLQVALLALPFLCAAAPAKTITIKGTFSNLPDSTKLLLIPGNTHKEEKPVAYAIVKNGSFEFKDLASVGPRMYYLKPEKTNGLFSLVVDNEDVTLQGKAIFNNQGDAVYFKLDEAEVTNSKMHQLYLQKRKPLEKLDSLYNAYHVENDSVLKTYMQARSMRDTVSLKNIQQSAEWKKFENAERNFFNTVESSIKGVVMDNKDSWWGPFLMLNTMSYFTEQQKPMYEAFSEEAKNSHYGKIVKAELFPAGFKGKKAPGFTLTDANGKSFPSTDLYKGKKYILLDFWASWCAPCRKEIPNLKAQYAKYAAKGFEIISVSTDQSEADWKKALKVEQLPWPNFRDLSGIANMYQVRAIPSTFLLNANGVILEENLRGEALGTMLERLFK